MFIHNHSDKNHGEILKSLLEQSTRSDLMVSYIKPSGVNFLSAYLKNRKVRILCSREMDITDPQALKTLVEQGVEVKVYDCVHGNFHPKLWLFLKKRKIHACVVGSANMSIGGLQDNVEVSVLFEAESAKALQEGQEIFNYFWNRQEASLASVQFLDEWAVQKKESEKTIRGIRRAMLQEVSPESENHPVKMYVRDWINIGVRRKTAGGTVRGRVWRGWFIIPDHGMVDDALIARLHRICRIIGGKVVDVSKGAGPEMSAICDIVRGRCRKRELKTSMRRLFIRQEKNYLMKFGFAEHCLKENGKPNRRLLLLTEAGKAFTKASTVSEQKEIYTRTLDGYTYHGLHLLRFLRYLLNDLNYLTVNEFSYFVNHHYSMEKADTILFLVREYRRLSESDKRNFREWYVKLFREKLEPTASNVLGNYEKNVKHTLSALSWCEGLEYTGSKIKKR